MSKPNSEFCKEQFAIETELRGIAALADMARYTFVRDDEISKVACSSYLGELEAAVERLEDRVKQYFPF